MSYDTVDHSLINRLLFRNMNFLNIYGLVYDIEADLFKDFNKLCSISLWLDKIKQFYHKGNKWLTYIRHNDKPSDNILAQRLPKTLLLITHVDSIFSYTYDYPDEDFCLFHHFPHDKLVYAELNPRRKIECSCTTLWLMLYTFNYFNVSPESDYSRQDEYFIPVSTAAMSYCLYNKSYEGIRQQCGFERRIERCKKVSVCVYVATQQGLNLACYIKLDFF